MSDDDQDTVLLGTRTSRVVQQQENIIGQAEEKKKMAIQSWMEGQGIERDVTEMEVTESGMVKLHLESDDDK